MSNAVRLFLFFVLCLAPCRPGFAILDVDADGMSDVWEAAYAGISLSPMADADSDGRINREEAQAGTNPLSSTSVLAMSEMKWLPGNAAQLKWPTVKGKRYQVQFSSYLQTWSDVGTTTAGDGAEASVTLPLSSTFLTGRALASRWLGMATNSNLATVRSYITGNLPPTDSPVASAIETPQTSPDIHNYGQWLRGWLIPPATGAYTFWIASDDASELWLSTNASSASKTRIAFTNSWTSFRQWNKYATQQSVAVTLNANQPYFFEVVHKEYTGGDHVSVSWSGPTLALPQEVIAGRYVAASSQSLAEMSGNLGAYFRVAVSDVDSDGDGISDADEILIGFNPNSINTIPRIADADSIRQLVNGSNVVTIGAPVSRAYESNNQPGRFTFFRSGNINALTIQYTVAGSAMPGGDYVVLTGTTTLGIAQNSVDVDVTAFADGLLETAESVTVTVVATSSYEAGSPGLATVTIDDAPDELFVATLRPDNGAASGGYGTAALNVAGNDVFANSSVSFGNLTTQQLQTEFYISSTGSGGPAVRTLAPGQISSQRWDFEPAAGYTKDQIVAAMNNGQLYARIVSSRFPGGEIFGQFVREQGWQNMPVPPAPPPNSLASPMSSDAARFLTQATFGPTGPEIARFLTMGYETWLLEQRNLAITRHLPYVQARRAELLARDPDDDGWQAPRQEAWWQTALTAPDQLRQRMAFALSEIFVVSDVGVLDGSHEGITNYYDLLATHAFGNYRNLLEAVTLSPIMGQYLSMVRNQKPDPVTGAEPDENYAREVMQLFSIGLNQLHADGSIRLGPNGMPLPTYTQADIVGLARVFTGWGYYYPSGTTPPHYIWGPRQEMNSMVQYPSYHDTGAKQILNGITIPAGQTGEQDLAQALDVIFNHPNIGPMIARQLIQRFVTSNPSPGYVYRIASVFNDNGAGVRGDLWATLKALLLDYEARSPLLLSNEGFGKQREPVLRISHMLRSLNARPPKQTDARYFLDLSWGMPQQAALKSGSVFNFFQPGYIHPGRIAQAGLFAPEFQITSETTTINQINNQHNSIFWGIWTREKNALNENVIIYLDHTEEVALLNRAGFTAVQNQQALLDLLNLRLLSGRMSAGLRQQITECFAEVPSWFDYTDDRQKQRVQVTAYLILASPEYAIQK